MLDGLGEQALEVGLGELQARLVELGAQFGGIDDAVGDVADRLGRQMMRRHPIDDHRPDGEVLALQLADRLDGLLDGHRLEQRHQMHHGLVRVQQLDDAVALVAQGAGLGQIGHGLGDVEEVADPARRRRVDHHRVVDPVAALVGSDHGLLDLPRHQDVAKPRRDGGDEVDGTDAAHGAAGESEVVEHVEVLEQRVFDVDRQCPHLSAAFCGGDLGLGGGQGRNIEDLRDALTSLALDEEDLLALGCQCQRESGRDSGFSGPALTGDEVQARLRSGL